METPCTLRMDEPIVVRQLSRGSGNDIKTSAANVVDRGRADDSGGFV
jgi:hypothetical protein